MKAVAAVLAILLFAAAATADVVLEDHSPSGYGAVKAASSRRFSREHAEAIAGGPIVAGGGALIEGGGRKMLQARDLEGIDGDGLDVTINNGVNVYSKIGKHCPTNTTADGPWSAFEKYNTTTWAVYGDLVHDAAVCNVASTGVGRVWTTASATASGANTRGYIYGGAAQDFGSARTNWESYGWSLFKLMDPPAGTYKDHVKIQGLQLHVIGNVGRGHVNSNCSIKAVSVAIYEAGNAPDYDPAVLNYTKKVDLTGANATTFTWTSNSTAILYLDIAQSPDTYPKLKNSTYYWLRVKMFADYGGSSGTGQCFIFWGMSSTVANNLGMRSRWQERVGGASGYSTTCVGAQFSGNETAGQNVQSVGGGASVQTAPGKFQSWWNCWNNGVNYAGANTGRRCSTYRSTVIPAIPSADCLDATNRARFNDYNYAFSGIQGEGGKGGTEDESGFNGGFGGAIYEEVSPL